MARKKEAVADTSTEAVLDEGGDEDAPAPKKAKGKAAKGKTPKKEKAKTEHELREERIKALAEAIPFDADSIKAAYMAAVDLLHDAIMAGDADAEASADERLVAARRRASGCEGFGTYAYEAEETLEAQCAAAPGDIPKWGQHGIFPVEHAGLSVIVKVEPGGHYQNRMSFAYYATRFDQVFTARHGYSYLHDAGNGDDAERPVVGHTIDAWARKLIEQDVASDDEEENDRCYPSTVYVLDAGFTPSEDNDDDDEPYLRPLQRGVVATDVTLPDGRDLAARAFRLAEAWDAARDRRGGKPKADSAFPDPKHASYGRPAAGLIIAISDAGDLVPVADFPTEGRYFVTDEIELDRQRTELTSYGHVTKTKDWPVLRYVADAANPGVRKDAPIEGEPWTAENTGAEDPESPGLPFHPYANLFPVLDGKDFDELAKDIKKNGLQESVVLLDGAILDGRNRYRALLKNRMVSPDINPGDRPDLFVEFEGEDALAWVLSKNLRRRHLSEGQRAIVAAKIANLKQGQRVKPANLQVSGDAPAPVTRQAAAESLQVSERSVASAAKVLAQGAPELAEAVEQGRVSVSTAEALTSLPKAEQAQIVARGEKEILDKAKEIRAERNAAKRETRLERIREISKGNGPLPNKRYPIIYGDPAWLHETWTENGKDRSSENHYPCMDLADIQALQLDRIAGDDALLLLWTTVPHLAKALNCLPGWGFEYKSHLAWIKDKIGTGYWFRNQHEILIVATRGDFPAPLMGTQLSSVLQSPVREHSRKPDEIRTWIEQTWPDLPRIELFCREPREGWDVWGNQAQPIEGEAGEDDEDRVLAAVNVGGGTVRMLADEE
ncbi:MT-A70 family methyltransferase [Hyphomonas sp.]|uniref:MT-A70 family methyltransferase n=1 Tax=Hyphomonas sp. TaxID=87 RepID=UPI0025C41299|nr:MT-A70 family methyltransferase [Hyphomonas sp.]